VKCFPGKQAELIANTLIGAQDALILLRASFSAPKVLYLMRSSPSAECALPRQLKTMDFRCLTTSSDLLFPRSPIQYCQIFSGCKLRCQSNLEVWGEKGYLACNSCLFGIGGEYASPSRPHFGIKPVPFCHHPGTVSIHLVVVS